MPTSASLEALIDRLGADLRPVRRLPAPALRATAWLAVVVAVALVLASFSDLGSVAERLRTAPDMWLAVFGSALTAVLAAFAVFELSLPDRQAGWAILPLPALALWIAASGWGCSRVWLIPGTHAASLHESMTCLGFILGLSVPLSVLTVVMVRRACPLRPSLTAAVGGLAVAAAAATLLNFFHPYDAAVTDLAVHAVAVAIVVGGNQVVAGQILHSGHGYRGAARAL